MLGWRESHSGGKQAITGAGGRRYVKPLPPKYQAQLERLERANAELEACHQHLQRDEVRSLTALLAGSGAQ